MKKRGLYTLLAACMVLISACSIQREDTGKLRDIDFTVVEQADAPKELLDKMEEKKEKTFKFTYADKGYLYIARGYGVQKTSGYSVKVVECYEAKNALCVKTSLMGPDRSEEIIEGKTYPSVIIKMEYSEKNVVFD